ncbi:MAG: phosphoribosylamine--glycine ligase [Bryobacter sp.]|nr:phosphoribosylamine--glycine ligase [Bryobacter sp.]
MKILIIGSGGREHAIAWRCHTEGHSLAATPGNPGIAAFAPCYPVSTLAPQNLIRVARETSPDLIIIGPEGPLVEGCVDALQAEGFRVFGPSKQAARLEASKIYSKAFMLRHGIPTAKAFACTKVTEAIEKLSEFPGKIVIKADGLAAGKGVVIARDTAEANHTISSMMAGELVGAAGTSILLEEFLEGEEVSFIVICDGQDYICLPPTQDHKAIFDGDRGPNTGGMGTYSDDGILTKEDRSTIEETIVKPTLAGLASEGTMFRGFLFIGLMMTPAGPKVLEYNVRLGDPETQSILLRVEGGFGSAIAAAANGNLNHAVIPLKPGASACVVLAAAGYPGKPRMKDKISGIPEAETLGAKVFHAGTKEEDGHLLTAGGRVLGVSAAGDSLANALNLAYAAVAKVNFEGMQFRKDIGQKGLKRYTES